MSDPTTPRRMRLPDIDEERIPGWRFARHALTWSLVIVAVLAVVIFSLLSTVTMNVTVRGDGTLERGVALASGVEHWSAALAVSERDWARVHVGDTAELDVPALSGQLARLRGRVASVTSRRETRLDGSAQPLVIVEVDASALPSGDRALLRDGYSVHGRIVTRTERASTLIAEFVRNRPRLAR